MEARAMTGRSVIASLGESLLFCCKRRLEVANGAYGGVLALRRCFWVCHFLQLAEPLYVGAPRCSKLLNKHCAQGAIAWHDQRDRTFNCRGSVFADLLCAQI